MGRRRSYHPLSVFMNTRYVGTLTRESTGAISFAYDKSWLDWENAMPVSLSLPLRKDRYIGAPVMAVFDNLLPDNDDIRKRVAERVGAQGTDAYSMLSELGRDCIGALQFLPDGEEPHATGKLSGEIVSEDQIEEVLNNLDVAPLGIRKERDFRISVAGAQEKTALLYHEGQWIEPSGTTPTTHIIKPQIGKLPNGMDLADSVENEYLCLKLLGAFGLRTANAEMARFGKRKALVVERFDRLWAKDGRLIRLPQEDFCQVFSIPPTRKYQNEGGPGIVDIIDRLRGSDEPTQDRRDFFKANILFWLMGATDGHAKNFSIALMPGGRFRMTPLYDVLTVQPTYDQGQIQRKDFKLAMRFGKSNHYKIENIYGRHIVETGVQGGLSKDAIGNLFEELHQDAPKAIEKTIKELPNGFPAALIESVQGAISDRLKRLD
ncbi:type II toxin-antitoxin system HipA family toxin (plasmid) [Roseibium aggregatum]|uniref:type II toxin-antitoxin system HipA family toxin n=1 Tax=Roseibium aggregatum TaxID=187304 RepID=UPI001E4674BE|nr:type II toxin-antitoxin system HipA family toxin [Roseibium aggregatum]UES59951.1 type II toxin-antitoxin system HipA family toxin [Roseibium aggregatum]